MMTHSKIVLSFAALLPVLALPAQSLPEVRASTSPAVSTKLGVVQADALIATWMIAESGVEVALARRAVDAAHGAEVKEFAQSVLEDHAKMAVELKKFAAAAEAGDGVRSRNGDSDTPAKPGKASGEDADSRVPEPKVLFDHVALLDDLGRRCAEEQTRLLQGKTGAEFDRCFMVAQVSAHTRALAMADVFGRYASKELQPVLVKANKTLRTHRERAKELCMKLDAATVGGESQGTRE